MPSITRNPNLFGLRLCDCSWIGHGPSNHAIRSLTIEMPIRHMSSRPNLTSSSILRLPAPAVGAAACIARRRTHKLTNLSNSFFVPQLYKTTKVNVGLGEVYFVNKGPDSAITNVPSQPCASCTDKIGPMCSFAGHMYFLRPFNANAW